jgi:hypothetical protein
VLRDHHTLDVVRSFVGLGDQAVTVECFKGTSRDRQVHDRPLLGYSQVMTYQRTNYPTFSTLQILGIDATP